MQLIKTLSRGYAVISSAMGRLAEYNYLLPVVAVLVLAVIWGITWNLITIERRGAEQAATALSRELAGTYEAQVVRALREIDQTLKLVQYSDKFKGKHIALEDLKNRGLLPSELLFTVCILDIDGNVVAAVGSLNRLNFADQADFNYLRETDALAVSRPLEKKPGEWLLRFGRRLNTADGIFAGAVMVTVDADYFVSGYEPSKLGERGVLGLLGTDGVFRVRRTGNRVSAGDKVDFAELSAKEDDEGTLSELSENPWDGVRRYTVARQIYDFPVAVIVGLSEDEQLTTVRHNARIYRRRAATGSALSLLGISLLWGMSRQLARVRLREAEAKMAYAERVEYLAYHDGLTGLPNRSLFSELLSESILKAHRYDRQLATLFLDLDRFKLVNDTLGHDAGDLLLKEVAGRLTSCLRESDTVARLGGDEFVVLIPELKDEMHVATVAQKILTATARPVDLLGQEFRVTVSIGISLYPADGEDEQTLKKNADIAMYQAKKEGKNNFQFYSEKLNATFARAACNRVGPAARPGAQRVRTVLSGQTGYGQWPDFRDGSAAALAAPRSRPGSARTIPADCRRNRLNCLDRQMDAVDRLSAKRDLARTGVAPFVHGREPDGAPVQR